MQVDFYGSKLCPRCAKAKKYLIQLQTEFPALEVNFIEVTTSPIVTIKNGICMIPALKTGDHKLSGLFLSKEQISSFLSEVQKTSVDK